MQMDMPDIKCRIMSSVSPTYSSFSRWEGVRPRVRRPASPIAHESENIPPVRKPTSPKARGLSDWWAIGLTGLRTRGLSDSRAFGLVGYRTRGPSDSWAGTVGRSEQWLDLCSRPSDEDVKWRSRRQESHPLPGSLNTIREE